MKNEKAEKAVEERDHLVLCSLMAEIKQNKKGIKWKRKVRLASDIKKPTNAGMLFRIDDETFFSFKKNMWIGDSGISCHITNIDMCLYDVTNINTLVQGSSFSMSVTKKVKLNEEVCQVNWIENLHVLWPMKYCAKAGVKLFHMYANRCIGVKFQVTVKTT